MATQAQIAAQIADNLNDYGLYYQQQDFQDSIQDGYDEIAAVTGCIEKGAAIDFVPNQIYYDMRTLIPDFLSLIAIWNRRVKRWMFPVSNRELDKMRENWETAIGEPYLFWPVNFRYVAIFPAIAAVGTVATNKMYVLYKAAADTLTASSSPIIPFNNQDCSLRNYGTMDLLEQAEEWNKAKIWQESYLGELEQIKKWVDQRDKERLLRLGGPF